MANVSKELWAVRTTASLPDSTGMLRVRCNGLSDLYDWTPEAREELRQREGRTNTAEIIGPLTREEYEGLSCGYRATPTSPVIYREWEMLG